MPLWWVSSSECALFTCLRSCSVGKRPLSRRQFPLSLSEEIMKHLQYWMFYPADQSVFVCVFRSLSSFTRYVPISASFSHRGRQRKGDGPAWALCPYCTPSLAINALIADMIIDIDSDLPDFKITLAMSVQVREGLSRSFWLWTWLSSKLLTDFPVSL